MASTSDWDYSNVTGNVGNNSATNDKSGFNAKPAGYYYDFTRQYYSGFGQFAYFGSATSTPKESCEMCIKFYALSYDLATFDQGSPFPYQHVSIRLIRDY